MKITPELIVGIFGLILTVLSIANTFLILRDRAQAPQKELERRFKEYDDRLDKITQRIDRHDVYFDNDNKRLKSQEKATTILLQSVLAIMTYLQSIPVNNEEAKQNFSKAVMDLNNYLTNPFKEVQL